MLPELQFHRSHHCVQCKHCCASSSEKGMSSPQCSLFALIGFCSYGCKMRGGAVEEVFQSKVAARQGEQQYRKHIINRGELRGCKKQKTNSQTDASFSFLPCNLYGLITVYTCVAALSLGSMVLVQSGRCCPLLHMISSLHLSGPTQTTQSDVVFPKCAKSRT